MGQTSMSLASPKRYATVKVLQPDFSGCFLKWSLKTWTMLCWYPSTCCFFGSHVLHQIFCYANCATVAGHMTGDHFLLASGAMRTAQMALLGGCEAAPRSGGKGTSQLSQVVIGWAWGKVFTFLYLYNSISAKKV